MSIQVIEATSKKWKVLQVLGALLFFPSAFWFMHACLVRNQIMEPPIILCIVGFSVAMFGKVLGWWNHG